MYKFILTLITLVSLLQSADKLNINVGKDFNENFSYETSYSYNQNFNLLNSNNIFTRVSYTYLDNENLKIYAFDPLVFSYNIIDDLSLELSVGLTYLSDKYISDKDFGMHFQFKDTASLVWSLSKDIDIQTSYTHYSNASLDKDNDGINLLSLGMAYKF